MEQLIKLKIKEESSTGENGERIIDSFIKSCINLDASILEPMIEEDQFFDDLDKYRFLAFLRAQFDSARSQGLKKMIVRTGRCELCVMGHKTYEFYGKKSTPRFAYVIEIVNGKVKNIFNCNASSGWNQK
ncbi:hypothetical protein K1F50_01555 [Muricauda oceani]|uniref:Nuclear transport factor 2 family protein n=1 Tax=Flagellimonas oceani TaxID=2698672 RepID=A0A6G7J222_9FLAO|nr:hypothetical protein [Allomuricauda oceani]MBW8241467.1 hypothetical protein [Allomuricauda oceani]QII44537.1 hypothetical protein GVT53_07555 [Allomuricauda oceani]